MWNWRYLSINRRLWNTWLRGLGRRKRINLSQNILGLTGLSWQVCSHILDAIYLHVLRSFVIFPTWFIPMRLQNLNFQPPSSIWNLQRKLDFLMIKATDFQSTQTCFPSLLMQRIRTQNVMSKAQTTIFLMTTLVWPTLHSRSTMPRVGNTLSPAPFRTGMPTS